MEICIVDGCNSEKRAKRYCMKHYKRVWRNGTLELKEIPNPYTPENSHFLNVLIKTKKELNISGEKLADLIETKIDTYRKWSQGQTSPNEEVQAKVLKILKDNV